MIENKKIFVIDDDMTALDIVDFLLEDEGYDVIRHSEGKSALEDLDKQQPDLVLIDLMMPSMNGQDCIKAIREKGITIPIIAFTAIDDPDIHRQAIDSGCNMVVTKPCKSNELVAKIKSLTSATEKNSE